MFDSFSGAVEHYFICGVKAGGGSFAIGFAQQGFDICARHGAMQVWQQRHQAGIIMAKLVLLAECAGWIGGGGWGFSGAGGEEESDKGENDKFFHRRLTFGVAQVCRFALPSVLVIRRASPFG